MADFAQLAERRTSTDAVYQHLYDEIVAVRLPPGTKISEAEIASQFGISRQPVRDAFSRLANDGLLLVRPQRATEVCKFSMRTIARARFVRAALEAEVGRRAATAWTGEYAAAFETSLKAQDESVAACDNVAFHNHDYDFHKLMCQAAGVEYAFETLFESKMQVDRLCVLSLLNQDAMQDLVSDHRAIFAALKAKDADGVVDALNRHLGRLDKTIETVRSTHEDFFEA